MLCDGTDTVVGSHRNHYTHADTNLLVSIL